MHIRNWVLLPMLACSISLSAQDKSPIKFGKVSPADFSVTIPAFDSGAHAVILADIGRSSVVGNDKGGFGYEFERKMRVYIVDQNGVDAGKFEIPVYQSQSSNMEEEISSLKGISYNLEAGKIVETKLESKEVFTQKISKSLSYKKFSMPQLKAGTLFELTYKIKSDYLFEFRPWEFQGDYPCLWSEYNVEIPEYHDFVYLKQGYLPWSIEKSDQTSRTYLIRDNTGAGQSGSFTLTAMANQKRWVIKDVPSIKEELYTTTIDNHRSKIDFQLSSIRYPNQVPILVMEDWNKVTTDLMKNDQFGSQVDKNNGWLDDIIKPVLGNATDPVEKTRRLFVYVRDNYKCTQNGMYTTTTLKDVVKTKSGNVADLNLLLLAMLRHEKIESYPVILSTRSHGITNEVYPLLDRFNYVVCAALIGENDYIMDASVPDLGFNKMPSKCYNGHARVLTAATVPIRLDADSLLERKVTLVTVQSDGKKFEATVQDNLGYMESTSRRGEIRESGQNSLLEKIKKSYGSEMQVDNLTIDSLKMLEQPIKLTYNLHFNTENEDLVYINPVMAEGYKENPFKAANRRYPVEIPYRIDQMYIFSMNVPDGYKVDDLPKSTRVMFNGDEGMFEYLISAENGLIQMRCRLKLEKATFQPDEYNSLRDFFGFVVKKQQEQIVLKKN
ncbi:MAG TPA: DUF3858 domain-containing protein [Flavihumibacter sp.]|nr:DUF3858 domain-containing protein [Flavihumibacter sp.]